MTNKKIISKYDNFKFLDVPNDPTVKKRIGTSSLCRVSHLVIQPRSRMRKRTKVATLRSALFRYARRDFGTPAMMKSCNKTKLKNEKSLFLRIKHRV
jgi:hypothetical protein